MTDVILVSGSVIVSDAVTVVVPFQLPTLVVTVVGRIFVIPELFHDALELDVTTPVEKTPPVFDVGVDVTNVELGQWVPKENVEIMPVVPVPGGITVDQFEETPPETGGNTILEAIAVVVVNPVPGKLLVGVRV